MFWVYEQLYLFLSIYKHVVYIILKFIYKKFQSEYSPSTPRLGRVLATLRQPPGSRLATSTTLPLLIHIFSCIIAYF